MATNYPIKHARRMRPEGPRQSGATKLSASEVNTVVRRLGYVALRTFEVIQGNLVSNGQDELAETLNDVLKPLVDMLVHFELEGSDDEIPQRDA